MWREACEDLAGVLCCQKCQHILGCAGKISQNICSCILRSYIVEAACQVQDQEIDWLRTASVDSQACPLVCLQSAWNASACMAR